MGYLARDAEGTTTSRPPYAVETVFANQLGDLEAKGYAPGEIGQAKKAYEDYLDAYQLWWDQFVESHVDNLDYIDRDLAKRLAEIERAHTEGDGR